MLGFYKAWISQSRNEGTLWNVEKQLPINQEPELLLLETSVARDNTHMEFNSPANVTHVVTNVDSHDNKDSFSAKR